MQQVVTISKAVGDLTRMRILVALTGRELCLCQIVDLLELAPSTVSKHVAQLVGAGLITQRKEGKWHFYRRTSDGPPAVRQMLRWVTQMVQDDDVIAQDRRRLANILVKDLEELCACYRT